MEEERRHKVSLIVQADLEDLKKLFGQRDQVQSLVEKSRDNAPCSPTETLLQAIKFYANLMDDVDDSESQKLVAAKKTNQNLEEDTTVPIVKLHLNMTKAECEALEEDMETIYSEMVDIDNYRLLAMTFTYIIGHTNDFLAFLGSPSGQYDMKSTCVVCCEPGQAQYCGSICCLKCQDFFQVVMRRRSLLSLRCGKNGTCLTEGDLSCRKCRYDRCRVVGMVDQYCYSEMPAPVRQECAVCQQQTTSSGSMDDAHNVVLGHNLCQDCIKTFDDAIAVNQVAECVQQPAKCQGGYCKKCTWDKMYRLGLFDMYKLKNQGQKRPCWMDNKCAVCTTTTVGEAEEERWMDIIVCRPCRSFLQASLTYDSHAQYCCPRGEVGRLCALSKHKRCPYCWFRRLEIEGVVERWQTCNGKPHQWKKLQDEGEFEEEQLLLSQEETTDSNKDVASTQTKKKRGRPSKTKKDDESYEEEEEDDDDDEFINELIIKRDRPGSTTSK